MSRVAIRVDPQSLARAQDLLRDVANGAEKALARALNRTLDGARTLTARELAAIVTAPQKIVRESLSVSRANAGKLSATLTLRGKNIPLIDFSHSQIKQGVSVKVFRDRPRERFRHAFIARMRNGHVGIFERQTLAGKPVGRLPILERHGPSVPTLYERSPGVSDKIESESSDRMLRELDHEVDFLLAKHRHG